MNLQNHAAGDGHFVQTRHCFLRSEMEEGRATMTKREAACPEERPLLDSQVSR